MNCDDTNEPAPRVGCGCRTCYLTREAALDPRLLALAQWLGLREATGYLAGRLDYGALHLTIKRFDLNLGNPPMAL